MVRNIGNMDKVIRVLVSVLFIGLVVSGAVSGTLAAVLGVFTVTFLATTAAGFCPLYKLVGINTCGTLATRNQS